MITIQAALAFMLMMFFYFLTRSGTCTASFLCKPTRRFYRRASLAMMPEGPEVRSLVDAMDARFGGERFSLVDAKLISGRYHREDGNGPPVGWNEMISSHLPARLRFVKCKGKFIFFSFVSENAPPVPFYILSTLGLTGGWSTSSNRRHVRASLTLREEASSATEELAFFDLRNFGTLKVEYDSSELEKKLSTLGFDWLDEQQRPSEEAWIALGSLAGKRKRPLAVFLMDQKKTSGIGNYILAEVLFRCAINPFANCSTISPDLWKELRTAIIHVIEESYSSQSGDPDRLEDFAFRVYAQQKTPEGNMVVREEGPHKRTIHWDPLTQTRGM